MKSLVNFIKESLIKENFGEFKNAQEVSTKIIDTIKENENKEAPTFAEVEAEENLENLIDDNIIPQEEENNASDFMEDDIETKNKKLMEQEKRFIPSFDMRWS